MIIIVREEKITISLNEKEKAELLKRAKEKHLPLASYCRSFLLSGDGIYYQTISQIPIERLKRPKPSKEAKNSHALFMRECVFELKQKLGDPKALNPIPKKDMDDILRRREDRMLVINKLKSKMKV